jgi:hypothetical protein
MNTTLYISDKMPNVLLPSSFTLLLYFIHEESTREICANLFLPFLMLMCDDYVKSFPKWQKMGKEKLGQGKSITICSHRWQRTDLC